MKEMINQALRQGRKVSYQMCIFFSTNKKKSKLLLSDHIQYQVKVPENNCGIVMLWKCYSFQWISVDRFWSTLQVYFINWICRNVYSY